MNCKETRKHLLGSTRPGDPSADVQTHLTSCSACREWQRQLLLVEKHVPMLPTPVSTTGKERTIQRLFTIKLEDERARQAQRTSRSPFLQFRSPQVRWAVGLAAAIALAIGGVWLMRDWFKPSDQVAEMSIPSKPLADRLLEHDLELAKAETTQDRLKTLADMADDLHEETHVLASDASAEDLKALASMYTQVVSDGIVKQAPNLAAGERRKVLDPIADRLDKTGNDAELLARRVPANAGPLGDIARTARDASRTLREGRS